MRKRSNAVGTVVLLSALVAWVAVAQSAMWVGAEIGGNFPSTPGIDIVHGTDIHGDSTFKPGVIGGATLGYDFINSGFAAYNWPDWMKYFSVATDITYNRLQFATINGADSPSGLEGYCVFWSFLFMAHYGFFPDSVVPTGRVVPYLGVGPGIFWSLLNLTAVGIGNRTSTAHANAALVIEPGIRWMALPNVSIDTSFRWRYLWTSYETEEVLVDINPLNQLSFLVRANYHF